ncbi:MAG: hypothetical protein AAGI90_04345 [Chlamydiota bacterium]
MIEKTFTIESSQFVSSLQRAREKIQSSSYTSIWKNRLLATALLLAAVASKILITGFFGYFAMGLFGIAAAYFFAQEQSYDTLIHNIEKMQSAQRGSAKPVTLKLICKDKGPYSRSTATCEIIEGMKKTPFFSFLSKGAIDPRSLEGKKLTVLLEVIKNPA